MIKAMKDISRVVRKAQCEKQLVLGVSFHECS